MTPKKCTSVATVAAIEIWAIIYPVACYYCGHVYERVRLDRRTGRGSCPRCGAFACEPLNHTLCEGCGGVWSGQGCSVLWDAGVMKHFCATCTASRPLV